MVAEVSVSADGELRVHRIVVAIDSGYVVNPDTCRAQAESNVVFGLGSILYQENNVKDGRVVESNFHDFPLPQIAEMPKVETVLVPTGGFWGGHGEPAHPSAGARRVQRDLRRHRQARSARCRSSTTTCAGHEIAGPRQGAITGAGARHDVDFASDAWVAAISRRAFPCPVWARPLAAHPACSRR